MSPAQSTNVDVSAVPKGATTSRCPPQGGVGRNAYRWKAPRIARARACHDARSLSRSRRPRLHASKKREQEDATGVSEARSIRSGQADNARRESEIDPPKRFPRAVNRAVSPVLPHRRAPSPSMLDFGRKPGTDRRVPPLQASAKRFAHAKRLCTEAPGARRGVSARQRRFGWQKSVERIVVERARSPSQEGGTKLDLARWNPRQSASPDADPRREVERTGAEAHGRIGLPRLVPLASFRARER